MKTSSKRNKVATIDDKAAIRRAIANLKEARRALRSAGAARAVQAVRRALKSAEGASRHMAHRLQRSAYE